MSQYDNRASSPGNTVAALPPSANADEHAPHPLRNDHARLLADMTASEERYRLLVELCPDPIAVHSGGVLVFANWAAARLVGAASPDDLLGRPVMSFVHPDYKAMAIARAQRTQEQGAAGELIEEKFVRLDGQPIDVEVVAIPAIFAGKPATQIVVRDVTAQKQAEVSRRLLVDAGVALSTSLDYLPTLERVAQLAVPVLADVCLVDLLEPTGAIQRLATAHAQPHQTAIAAALERCLPTLDPHGMYEQMIKTGEAITLNDPSETQLAWFASGSAEPILHHEAIASLVCMPLRTGGRTIGALTWLALAPRRQFSADDREVMEELARRAAVAIDNAHLYRAEQHARRIAEHTAARLQRLQSLTLALGDTFTSSHVTEVVVTQGIAALHARAGSVALVRDNGTMEIVQSVGYSHEVIEPWRHFSIALVAPLTDAARTGTTILIDSLEALHAQYPVIAAAYSSIGDQAWVSIPLIVDHRTIGVLGLSFAAPQHFTADDRAFMLTLARQCSQALERARLYEAERIARAEAQEALRAREQFFSVAAHELKTPLTSLLGYTQIFQRRAVRENSLNARDQRALDVISSQVSRLSMLVGDLLNVARLQIGQFTITRTTIDLVALAQRLVEEVQPSLERHTIRLETPDEPLLIEGDALRLEQVLQNLLQNAIKYSPEGGEINVRVERQEATGCVSVIDYGIGIPQASQAQLFQRFYRADNVDDRHISGMGIGLYVVKEIVTRHGGTIEVASHEGEGSTFTVRLPLCKA